MSAEYGARIWPPEHSQFAYDRSQLLPAARLKTILLWNKWFHWDADAAFFFGTGQQPFIDAQCPAVDCFVTNNRYALNAMHKCAIFHHISKFFFMLISRNVMPPSEYDAILFFYPMLNEVPFTYSRKSDQLYVFVNEEPPVTESRAKLSDFDGFFNLTATYRSDSDIHWPYGAVERLDLRDRKASDPKTTTAARVNYAQGKTKLVAWFASNCKTSQEGGSNREVYVGHLKKYVDVDVYGACGDGTCWSGDQDGCYDMLDKDYKFYLAFENAFCREYVTEKFFEILDRNIVRYPRNISYLLLWTPVLYISTAQRLGAYRLRSFQLQFNSAGRLVHRRDENRR